jgi:hypothetical protein
MEKTRVRFEGRLSQAEYDQLVIDGLVNRGTVYFIKDSKRIYEGSVLFSFGQGANGIPTDYTTELPDGTLQKRLYSEDGDEWRLSFLEKLPTDLDFHVRHTFEFAVREDDGIGVIRIDNKEVGFSDSHSVYCDDIDQLIDGNKTFLKELKVPNPTKDDSATTKFYVDTEIDTLKTYTDSLVSGETARAESAEASLSGYISGEAARLDAAIVTEHNAMVAAVNAESSRAQTEERRLATELSGEVVRAETEELRLATELSGEVLRATTEENRLDDIKINRAVATKTDSHILGDITILPTGLDTGNIHKIALNVDDDSFVEYDVPVKTQDGINLTIDASGILISTPLSGALTSEIARAEAAEAALSGRIEEVDQSVVHISGAETITGAKTFDEPISGSISKLTTPIDVIVDLEKNIVTSFDGSADLTAGISGVLPVENGGTGLNYDLKYQQVYVKQAVEVNGARTVPFEAAEILATINGTAVPSTDITIKSHTIDPEPVLIGNTNVIPSVVKAEITGAEEISLRVYGIWGKRADWIDGTTRPNNVTPKLLNEQYSNDEFYNADQIDDILSKTGNVGFVMNAYSSDLYKKGSSNTILDGGEGYKLGDVIIAIVDRLKSWAVYNPIQGHVTKISSDGLGKVEEVNFSNDDEFAKTGGAWFHKSWTQTDFDTKTNGSGTGLKIKTILVTNYGSKLSDLNVPNGSTVTVLEDESFNGQSREYRLVDLNHHGDYEWVDWTPYKRQREFDGDVERGTGTYVTVNHSLSDIGGEITLSDATKNIIDNAALRNVDETISGKWTFEQPIIIPDGVENDEAVSKSQLDALNDYVDNEISGVNVRIDTEVEDLNDRIDAEVSGLNTRIDNEVDTLDAKISGEIARAVAEEDDIRSDTSGQIDNEVSGLNDRIDNEVSGLNTRIDTEISGINIRIDNEVSGIYDRIDNERQLDDDNFTEAYQKLTLHSTKSIQAVQNSTYGQSANLILDPDPAYTGQGPKGLNGLEITDAGVRVSARSISEQNITQDLWNWINRKIEYKNPQTLVDGHIPMVAHDDVGHLLLDDSSLDASDVVVRSFDQIGDPELNSGAMLTKEDFDRIKQTGISGAKDFYGNVKLLGEENYIGQTFRPGSIDYPTGNGTNYISGTNEISGVNTLSGENHLDGLTIISGETNALINENIPEAANLRRQVITSLDISGTISGVCSGTSGIFEELTIEKTSTNVSGDVLQEDVSFRVCCGLRFAEVSNSGIEITAEDLSGVLSGVSGDLELEIIRATDREDVLSGLIDDVWSGLEVLKADEATESGLLWTEISGKLNAFDNASGAGELDINGDPILISGMEKAIFNDLTAAEAYSLANPDTLVLIKGANTLNAVVINDYGAALIESQNNPGLLVFYPEETVV